MNALHTQAQRGQKLRTVLGEVFQDAPQSIIVALQSLSLITSQQRKRHRRGPILHSIERIAMTQYVDDEHEEQNAGGYARASRVPRQQGVHHGPPVHAVGQKPHRNRGATMRKMMRIFR